MPDSTNVPGAPSIPTETVASATLPLTLAECHALIQAQAVQLHALQAQVSLLQERVDLDSRNSSKPPSSDGPGKPNRAQRRASNRKRGAQPGHKGSFRTLVDASEVDRIVTAGLSRCASAARRCS